MPRRRWTPDLVVVAVWAMVAVPSIARRFMEAAAWGFAVEAVVHLALGLLLARCRPLVSAIGGLGRLGKASVLLAAAGLLFGQLSPWNERATFPVSRWAMYSGLRDDVVNQVVLEGVRPTGVRIVVAPDAAFPSLTHGRLASVLRQHRTALEDGEPGAGARLDTLLRAIGQQWNGRFPAAHLQRLELRAVAAPLRDWPERRPLQSRLIRAVQVGPA